MGKTTTAVNLAAGIAQLGRKVLLVDCDPQGNATTGVGVDKREIEVGLYDVLMATSEGNPDLIREALVPVGDNLDVLPATLDLAGLELALAPMVGREMVLRDALDVIRSEYDWVFIDAPPSLGVLTVNVLAACDEILVPLQTEFYALEGLSQLMRTVDMVRKRINPSLKIGKVLLTMHDPRARHAKQVAEEVQDYFGDKVAAMSVPRNIKMSEAPGFGKPAVEMFPESKGAQAYMALSREVAAQ